MKKIVFFLFTIFFSLITFATPVFAEETPRNIVVPANQIINSDYFAAGNSVTVMGTINGDAYVAGGNVTFDGIVNGDIIAAGGTITIRGAAQNVRVAGGNITINGTIEKNLTVFGGNVSLGDNARLMGSIVAGGGSVNLLSAVGRGATLAGGNVVISNLINGNVYAGTGQLTLQPQAIINGNLVYVSDQTAQVLPGAKVNGKLTHTLPKKQTTEPEVTAARTNALLGLGFAALTIKAITLLSLLIIGWILLALVPNYVKKVTDCIVDKTWMSLGTGFVAIILAPIVFIILLATVIGIPLALVFIALFCIMAFVSKLFVMLLLGEKIGKAINSKMPMSLALFIGAVVYGIIVIIPIFGWLFDCVAVLLGLGSLLIQKKQIYLSLHKDKIL